MVFLKLAGICAIRLQTQFSDTRMFCASRPNFTFCCLGEKLCSQHHTILYSLDTSSLLPSPACPGVLGFELRASPWYSTTQATQPALLILWRGLLSVSGKQKQN
jgi:hypothetical protein